MPRILTACATAETLAPVWVSGNKFRAKSAETPLSPAQVRAARGLLDWTRECLAEASGVSMRAQVDIEAGRVSRPQRRTLRAIEAALRIAGVEFIPANGGGPGVRLSREEAIRQAVNDAKGSPLS
jgi:transcriptional regulator with XRE-family HTH domain